MKCKPFVYCRKLVRGWPSSQSYKYGDTVKIKTTNNGVALKNKDIDLYLERKNGEVYPYWGTTNSNGVFNFKLNDIISGSYKVWGYVDLDHEFHIDNSIKITKTKLKETIT